MARTTKTTTAARGRAPSKMRGRANPLAVLALVAGKGPRFRWERSKVGNPLRGRPMLAWIRAAAAPLKAAETVIVVGPGAADVREAAESSGWPVRFATQKDQ